MKVLREILHSYEIIAINFQSITKCYTTFWKIIPNFSAFLDIKI